MGEIFELSRKNIKGAGETLIKAVWFRMMLKRVGKC